MIPGAPLRFIALEGGEGVGKSTQARLLATRLRDRGHDVVLTREPGGTPGAETIRGLLVEGEVGRWQPRTEALLHFAARAEHLAKVIKPALEAGKWVITDRFADSTLAYQGYGLGVDLDWLWSLRRLVVGAWEPGLTILLDLSPLIGLARSREKQSYERLEQAVHERLAAGFRILAKAQAKRSRIIDAQGSETAISDEIAALVAQHYGGAL